MQTLYGVRFTDRARVDEIAHGIFRGYFDDYCVGDFPTGRAALHGISRHVEDERAKRQAAEQAAKREEHRCLPASYRAFDELVDAIGSEAADKIKSLIEAMIAERHER